MIPLWYVAGALVGAAAAWRLGWLDRAGGAAAALVGGCILGTAGMAGGIPLGVFFVTSTLLGRIPGRSSGRRHAARDARQVLANGGVAAAAAVGMALGGGRLAAAAMAGALAAAAADTWATEIGTRFGGPPRQLGWGPSLRPGASGGVTVRGTAAGVAGAAGIALAATVVSLGAAVWPVVLGGIAGLLADSALGGTLQALYRCPACGGLGDVARDACGQQGALVRGWSWLDNDAVNLGATVCGATVALWLQTLSR